MNITTRPSDTQTAEVLIERARTLIPALRQRAPQTNSARQLPKDTIADYRRLGLTRCLQPAMFGGSDSNYHVFSKMLRVLARGCGSSAWVAAVHGEHSWIVGSFPLEAQHEMWDSNPHAVASASVAPNGIAERVAGGFRLSGRWGFASGIDHADWILLGAMLKDGGAPEPWMFLLPIGQVEIIDDWHVMGLCGTGSKSLTVKDVMIPAARGVSLRDLRRGTAPGGKVHAHNPLYRTPRHMMALFSLSSVVVGLAERAVDDLCEFNRERRSRGQRIADLESIQLMVAEASAQADAAAVLSERSIEDNIRLVESGQEISSLDIARSRRNASYAARLAQSSVRLIFEAAGGTALQLSNPLQEIYRDISAGASHVSITWNRAAVFDGQIRLGVPVDMELI
jgi:3-hydroxy-9,10-secoandrosta-1,3,5(10)-triene-9,17-dione monooxygenase